MVRILAAFATFKDTLPAKDVGEAVLASYSQHLLKSETPVECKNLPLSDGGEGFLHSLRTPLNLEIQTTKVICPYVRSEQELKELLTSENNNTFDCEFGINKNEQFAVIEMAKACGIEHVPVQYRNPYFTSTYGLGQVIMHVYRMGYKKILLGIGGSSTNDAGLGALQAMGLKIKCTRSGEPKYFFGKHLTELESISLTATSATTTTAETSFPKLIQDLDIDIACDVQNPFLGKMGAVNVFSKQKGATPEQQIELEKGMRQVAKLVAQLTSVDLSLNYDSSSAQQGVVEGAGAAGGIAGSFHTLQGAVLKKGIELLGDYVHLEKEILSSDIVFTGEGCYDYQTKQGKVVSLIQKLTTKHNKPLFILCGKKDGSTEAEKNVFDLCSMFPMDDCLTKTRSCLEQLVSAKAGEFDSALLGA